jgi:hypothetical protein
MHHFYESLRSLRLDISDRKVLLIGVHHSGWLLLSQLQRVENTQVNRSDTGYPQHGLQLSICQRLSIFFDLFLFAASNSFTTFLRRAKVEF